MKVHVMSAALSLLGLVLMFACAGRERSEDQPEQEGYTVPVRYHKLANGLRVVLSEDHTAPVVTLAIYYNIGFRIEPRERTGFAHLFEHMMFQGSENLGKMEFVRLVQRNGGVLNGSTRFDFTNYFEIVPSHKLETMLWAEADRMRGLAITGENLENQQGVVINEVKVNVHNTPYGGFPWLYMPQHAFENWYNSHNFYGELRDIEAATLEDVRKFFDTYYAPDNAALVVVGDFEPGQAMKWIEQYFGPIPAADPPEIPDISEPRREQEKVVATTDTLASRPALAFSYPLPERNSPEYYAFALLDRILLQGEDSRLHQALVQKRGYTGSVSGGINLLGNMFNYNGPVLWTAYMFHDSSLSPDTIMAAVDSVMSTVREQPVGPEVFDRALVKFRSSFYDMLTDTYGFGRADLLACFALFDDRPERINEIEARVREVTPELMLETAREYFRPTARTVLKVEPGK